MASQSRDMQKPNPDSRARFLEKLRSSLADGSFIKLTLSNRRKEGVLRNVYGRLVDLKGGRVVSFTLREATRDITRNEPFDSAAHKVDGWMTTDFQEAHLFTKVGDWRWKEGSPLKAAKPETTSAMLARFGCERNPAS